MWKILEFQNITNLERKNYRCSIALKMLTVSVCENNRSAWPKIKRPSHLRRFDTFIAMTNANPGIYDGLVRCAGMHEMDVGFSFAGCFRQTLAGVYSFDDANTLQRWHSLQFGGSCTTTGIQRAFLEANGICTNSRMNRKKIEYITNLLFIM